MKNLLKISGLAFLCGLTAFNANAGGCTKVKLDLTQWKTSNEYLFVNQSDNDNDDGMAFICGTSGSVANACGNNAKIAVGTQGGNNENAKWANRNIKGVGVFTCSKAVGGDNWKSYSGLSNVPQCTSTSGKRKYFDVKVGGETRGIYGTHGETFFGAGQGYAVNPCWMSLDDNNGGNNGGGNNGGGNNGGNNGGGNNGGDFYRGDGGPNNTNWNDNNNSNSNRNNNSNSNRNNNRNANQNTANGGAGGEGGMGYGEGGAGYGEGGSAYGEQNSSQRLNNRNAAQGGAGGNATGGANSLENVGNITINNMQDLWQYNAANAECVVNLPGGQPIRVRDGQARDGKYSLNECTIAGAYTHTQHAAKETDYLMRCFDRGFHCCPTKCEKGYEPAEGFTNSCGCVAKNGAGNGGGGGGGGGSKSCMSRKTIEGIECCKKDGSYHWDGDDYAGVCRCPSRFPSDYVFRQEGGYWDCFAPKTVEPNTPTPSVTCDEMTGARLTGDRCSCTIPETRLVMEGTFGHCVCSDPNKELKGSVCEYGQSYIAKFEKTIREVRGRLDSVMGTFKESVWKDEDGNFNTARLASDSIAGVVLGTTGGLVTSKLVKKNQLKKGFEAIQCSIGGQTNASYGDEFTVGLN